MFDNTLPPIDEKNLFLNRRIGIQLISTTGQIYGYKRPILPHCPLAYPNSILDFSVKSPKLCDETIKQRDTMLSIYEEDMLNISENQLIKLKKVT